MRETSPAVRTAEKIAAVIAVVAALIVLNGAWGNQHTWQNVSWRVAMAAVLLSLAVIVQTSAVTILQARRHVEDETRLPDFLRTGAQREHTAVDESVPTGEAIGAGERR